MSQSIPTLLILIPALPLAATIVTAVFGDRVVHLPVSAAQCDVDLPINFTNQIVPIFTKLGCHAGGCHAKASGQHGVKISLLGFDDFYWATLLRPRLTVVRQPAREIGMIAARILIDHIEGRANVPAPALLETQLIVRDSCCPPKKA